MPTISIVAFQGTGGVQNKESPYYLEPGLVRAGHVGLGGIIEDKIIGFSPTPETIKTVGGEELLMEQLVNHSPQPGRLQDDTAIFERAKELADAGERTTVWELPINISEETLESIKQWYNENREATYNFPKPDGSFEPDEYNCATFPSIFGIELPQTTGSIKVYIFAMIAKGATKWQSSNP